MARVNITIPDGLLDDIDRTARAIGQTRSGFLQEAGARYITATAEEHERVERAQRVERARQRARKIGDRLAPGPDGATLIRELRDAPPRLTREENAGDV
ncbi:MAG: type II toxin-antitoxin system HicB family antitoxin [Actinomycetota bacterium]|nr:type II toxin-antitoxin system HicB family antitoxin [Actinomycetota bacterium]